MQLIINAIYRHPKAKIKTIKRFGGIINYLRMLREQKKMEGACNHLVPVQSHSEGLKIYFLTGKKYIYQTIFCIHSLVSNTKERFHFILVDDGSFNPILKKKVNRLLPGATIIAQNDIERNLDLHLSKEKHPLLRSKRRVYPHIRKLTDIHTIPGEEWKLVLDSDMLFWKEPIALISWLKKPLGTMYMLDINEAYGYSRQLMESLCKSEIPKLVNVGVFGLNSNSVNFADLENWISALESKEGQSYYLEQGLSAMLIRNQPSFILPKTYKTCPTLDDLLANTDILHHYVDLSKELYYKHAWKRIA